MQQGIGWLARHWLALANLLAAAILLLAFLAPALMAAHQPEAAQRVYGWLAPHDHQLPQRSYFLFGADGGVRSYSLEQVMAAGAEPGRLRLFVGNDELGYKMALNQRMTAIFGGIVGGGLLWTLAGRRPRLGALWFILALLPLLSDGFSHMASEGSTGFRDTNAWAMPLIGHAFPPEFYTGTTIGTLNWWLRTLTGLLFGVAFVWFLYTYLDIRFTAFAQKLAHRNRRLG
jgi:uncharacterized membrane protein